MYSPRHLGVVNKALTATAGTVSLGSCRRVVIQAVLDGHATYEVAVKPSDSASATCSKSSAAAVLEDMGTYETNFGAGSHYMAYRLYNGATGATGASTDKLIGERLG